MATPRLTIEVNNILQGGKTCTSPTIEAHLINGLVMPCPVVDGKIELQMDGMEQGYCFDLIIDCDDCNTCPPQHKRVCLCDTNDDCSACETCTSGICVSNCEDDEFCNNGQCKECLVDGDCPCNKECIEGSCACPPDLPNEFNGCCYECIEGETNDSCQVCLGGHWAAKDCGENWLLNPETCTCEQCLDSGDCSAPNTCCVDGKCDCCPGYYFDPASGGCLEIPDCNDGNDCPDCFDCVNGVCQEISCPTGYVRSAIAGHCCLKVCDCDAPSCPEGYTCTSYDESTCYCKPCSGTCVDNDDCGLGCGCYSGNCQPKPRGCDGPCYTGNECGVGCGCLDNECVDCSTLDCNNTADCLLALGCDCHEGNCEGSGCEKHCNDGTDCLGDCGCEDSECVPCSSKTCVDNNDCPEGCLCNGGICGKNPCDTVYCVNPGDCGENCGCKDGMCVPCSTLDCIGSECSETPGCECSGSSCGPTGRPEPCEDDLRVTRVDDECKLKAQLDTTSCCACPVISLDVTGAFVTTTLTVTGKLRKGTTVADPLLSATGVDNELPTSGSVKYVIYSKEIEVDSNDAPTGVSRVSTQNWVANFAGVDTKAHAFTIVEVGDTYMDAGSKWKVIHVCVNVEHVTTFVFPNECQYKVSNREVLCDTNQEVVFQLTKVTLCKTPLFTWSESSTGASYSVMKKEYGTRLDSDSYVDYADYDDGLEVCKYYKVDVDCGCDTPEYYSCNGDDAAATKLVFCQPADLDITSNDDCNSDIDIAEVELCDVMCAASYKLYINGVLEDTYTADEDCILFAGGLNITKSFAITEVKLVFTCDTCEDCTIIKNLNITGDPCDCAADPLSLSVDVTNACTTGIDYTITHGAPTYTVVIKKGSTTIYSTTKNAAGTYTYNNVLTNGTYILEVTDGYGCKKILGFTVSACCAINVTGLSYDCATNTISGIIIDVHGSGTYTVEVGSPVIYTYSEGTGAFAETDDLMNGTYDVKVTDSVNASCYWTGRLYVGCDGMEMDIYADCDATDPTLSCIHYENLTGASLPAMRKLYIGNPVTRDGNGCPSDSNQFVFQTTNDPYYYCSDSLDSSYEAVIVVEDAIGRTRCFNPVSLLSCGDNAFSFTTRQMCDGGTKQVCITASKTGTYSVIIGPDAAFDYTFTGGVEVCFDSVLADGTYNVSLTNGAGVTVTHSLVITTCSNFVVTYDCESGLTILRDGSAWTGKIRVDGSPIGYWSYSGPNTVYLADTTPDHILTIHDTNGDILNTSVITGIDCCSITISGLSGICDPVTHEGYLEFDVTNAVNPGEPYTVTIKNSSGVAVENTAGYVGGHYISGSLNNDTYTVYVYDDSYHVPNIGVGMGLDCHTTGTAVLYCTGNCTISNVDAVYKGEANCPNGTAPNTWRVKAINNEVISLNYKVYRKPNTYVGACPAPTTDCSTVGYTLIGQGTVAAGGTGCVTVSSLSDTTACFMVVFSDLTDPNCKYCVKATFEV